MDPAFVINDIYDDDENNRSSSLPSPEEARINLEMETNASSSSFRPVSNSDISKNSEETAHSSDDEVGFANHDSSQLPSPEEVRMSAPRRSSSSMSMNGGNKRKAFFLLIFCCLIIVTAVVIALVMVLGAGGAEDDGGLEFLPLQTDAGNEASNIVPLLTPAPSVVTTPATAPTNLRQTAPPVTPVPTTATPSASPTEVASGSPTATPTKGPTATPTTAHPTLTRYDQMVQILIQQGVSTKEDLEKEDSPQQQALVWITQTDSLALPMSQVERLVQRYILAVLYYSMGGTRWRSSMSFLSARPECSWYITYSNIRNKKFGASCNSDGKVNVLNFRPKFLTGTFPMELSKLTDLERLDVFNNKGLRGGFPSFLKGMPKINFIGLHYSDLTGTLPSWLGGITTLKSLVLSNNEFQGALPESMTKLNRLEDLYLDDNQFQSDISVLRGMGNLRHLVLEDNQFTGSFDEFMVANWNRLETFDASHNRIESTIPSKLFMISNLRIVDLHENNLFGPIPKFSQANTALEMLTLNNNNLNGEIPSILGECTKLRHIDLTSNMLTSTLPVSLGNLANLEIFYLAQNPFDSAPIPTSFSKLQSLKQISLKSTNRNKQIPSWMGHLPDLTMLDLDGNDLTGTLPASLGYLSNLQYLLLNRNKLEGTIPSQLSGMSKLSFFVVDKNKLTGSADAVCSVPNALESDLFAAADCRGTNPEMTCSCCNLCCADGDTACNDDVWLADSNPMWELGYQRAVTVEFDAEASRSYTIQFTGDIPP